MRPALGGSRVVTRKEEVFSLAYFLNLNCIYPHRCNYNANFLSPIFYENVENVCIFIYIFFNFQTFYTFVFSLAYFYLKIILLLHYYTHIFYFLISIVHMFSFFNSRSLGI